MRPAFASLRRPTAQFRGGVAAARTIDSITTTRHQGEPHHHDLASSEAASSSPWKVRRGPDAPARVGLSHSASLTLTHGQYPRRASWAICHIFRGADVLSPPDREAGARAIADPGRGASTG
jgi:hypothetical protein